MSEAPPPTPTPESLIEHLARELLKDRKAERRLKLFRWSLVALGILVSFSVMFQLQQQAGGNSVAPLTGKYVAAVRIKGTIGGDGAQKYNPMLVSAFEDKHAEGVVLIVNSPGGAAVQSALIHDRLKELKMEHPDKKVIVVAEDLLASGAYMVAVAADKIYVNPSTITGSIGVISRGFGFEGLIDKIGVDRRVIHSGNNKNRLDPFSPQRKEDILKMQDLLSRTHVHFANMVKEGRGDKLKGPEDQLFSGDFWTGEEALEMGLVDGMGGLAKVLKDEFGAKKIKEYGTKRSVLDVIIQGAKSSLETVALENETPTIEAVLSPSL
jgi:protease IV